MKSLKLATALLSLALVACGDVELPPAEPLSVEREAVSALYGAAPGPHSVVTHRDVTLGDAEPLQVNLYYPEDGADYPLVLFSHGNWSDKDSYDAVLQHWASHGYAVLATNHKDCCGAPRGIFNSLRYGQLGLVLRRVEELDRLRAGLEELATAVPTFAGKADEANLAVAGHSFGAFTAQQYAGAGATDPDTGEVHRFRRTGVTAVVALSPPGPMFDIITDSSWQPIELPMLVTTGTWDIQPSFWPDWRMHLMSYESAQPHDKYALVVQGADHYLGNLICRTGRDAEPQSDALTSVHIATTAFLDAQLKGIADAARLLGSDTLQQTTAGFAVLQRR